jgi:transposase
MSKKEVVFDPHTPKYVTSFMNVSLFHSTLQIAQNILQTKHNYLQNLLSNIKNSNQTLPRLQDNTLPTGLCSFPWIDGYSIKKLIMKHLFFSTKLKRLLKIKVDTACANLMPQIKQQSQNKVETNKQNFGIEQENFKFF